MVKKQLALQKATENTDFCFDYTGTLVSSSVAGLASSSRFSELALSQLIVGKVASVVNQQKGTTWKSRNELELLSDILS